MGNRLSVGILHRLDRRRRRHVLVIGAPGRLGADDAYRYALVKALIAPMVPTAVPTSTAPEITACWVSPLPEVYRISSTRPCLLKIPARCPSSPISAFQLPR